MNNYIIRRRILMTLDKKLPRGYTPLDFIECNDNQINTAPFIDTGYIHKSYNLRVKFEAQWTGERVNTFENFYGIMDNHTNYTPRFSIFKYSNMWTFGTNITLGTQVPADNNRHIFEHTSKWINNKGVQELKIDGKIIPPHGSALDAGNIDFETNTLSMYIFRRHSPVSENPIKMKLYNFKFWNENNKLLFDMVPCLNPNGEAGLYNYIEGKFYGSANDGKFLPGNRIVELPKGYQQVEYIANTNDIAAYINTGIIPNLDTAIEVDTKVNKYIPNNNLFGCRNENGAVGCFGAIYFTAANKVGFYKWGYSLQAITADTLRHKYYLSNTRASIDNIDFNMPVGTDTNNTDKPLFILGFNDKYLTNYSQMQYLYGCKLWNDNNLTRDYIPCINPDGVAGLFDLVEKKFYGSADPSHKFITGDIINVKNR